MKTPDAQYVTFTCSVCGETNKDITIYGQVKCSYCHSTSVIDIKPFYSNKIIKVCQFCGRKLSHKTRVYKRKKFCSRKCMRREHYRRSKKNVI